MKKWVALFRGVNVGGKNKLPMAGLKAELTAYGFEKVKTYIQSGNVVFYSKEKDAQEISKQIADLVIKKYGFSLRIMTLSFDKFSAVADACPFNVSIEEGNLLHFFFLSQAPNNMDIDGIKAIQITSEEWAVIENVFYFYAPDGFGRSKLAIRAEKLFGVDATVRNYRTVSKILEM